MEMAPPFSSFMLDRTAVRGGYYKNGSAIFILYACVPKGNHVVFMEVRAMKIAEYLGGNASPPLPRGYALPAPDDTLAAFQ
jgi:hypothetical protein